jgi:hypothetical protein
MDGQLILPLLDLLENAQCALEDLIDVMGRATIETVLRMSAAAIAGPRQQGKKSDRDIVYHGTQKGGVAQNERDRPCEEPPLGLILCAGKSEEHVELLQLDASGIRVARYLTELPPRELLEKTLLESIHRARQRLAVAGRDGAAEVDQAAPALSSRRRSAKRSKGS